ncbi:hemerythrin domain-containing protein [Niallia sp. XMNu-256]|uniref:hypothetical protein n=1 Tax=Niallia sp. XMNu-256 TaxID=3082444 RepID=UPI0030CBC6FC
MGEHGPFRKQLIALFSLCNQVEMTEDKAAVYEELRKEVIDFEKNLKFHSIREEEILFRMMEVYISAKTEVRLRLWNMNMNKLMD